MTMPNADQAMNISRVLDTTVEYLVNGEEGKEYVIKWALDHGNIFRPPDRLKALCEIAEIMADDEIKMLSEFANTMRKNKMSGATLATEKNAKSS